MEIKTKNNLLLLIDMQYDFCNPDGALYVPGSEKDVKRISSFITQNNDCLDQIVLTQDNHQVIDISHPKFWHNKRKENPKPFTQISFDDISKGKWKPEYNEIEAVNYIQQLELQGEYPHVIWPEHCIIDSKGVEIIPELMDSVINWSKQGKQFEIIKKGLNPLTEHFGVLRANIPMEKDPDTKINLKLVETLNKQDHIYIAGEAKSHCVANTVKQMLEIEGLASKMIILEDCMSDVPSFEHIADEIFSKAKELGVKFEKAN